MLRWLSFWWKCLKWAFWRWDTTQAVMVTVLTYLTLAVPLLAKLLAHGDDPARATDRIALVVRSIPTWAILLPFAVLILLIAPYAQYRDSERRRRALARRFGQESFYVEFYEYRQTVGAFMDAVRIMYEEFSGGADLDRVLGSATHMAAGCDGELMAFARAVYPKNPQKTLRGFWRASRVAMSGLVEFWAFENFDGERRDLGEMLDHWRRLYSGRPIGTLVSDTLRTAPHEDVVKLLGYIEKARVEAKGHKTSLAEEAWWRFGKEWSTQLRDSGPSTQEYLPPATPEPPHLRPSPE